MGLLLAGSYCRVEAGNTIPTLDSMFDRVQILVGYLEDGGKLYEPVLLPNSYHNGLYISR